MPTQKVIDEMREKDNVSGGLRIYNPYLGIGGIRIHGFVASGVLLMQADTYFIIHDGEAYYVDYNIPYSVTNNNPVTGNLVRKVTGGLSMQVPDMRYNHDRNEWTLSGELIYEKCIHDKRRQLYAFFSYEDGRAIIRHV